MPRRYALFCRDDARRLILFIFCRRFVVFHFISFLFFRYRFSPHAFLFLRHAFRCLLMTITPFLMMIFADAAPAGFRH